MRVTELAQIIWEELKGISESDLTKAEKNILKIVNKILDS